MLQGNLEAMKKIESEKNSVLNEYSERLSAETAARKREIIMLNRRITVLMQENTVLRSSLASSKNSRFDGGGVSVQKFYVFCLVTDKFFSAKLIFRITASLGYHAVAFCRYQQSFARPTKFDCYSQGRV